MEKNSMKTKFFLILALTFLNTKIAFADFRVGNGGDALEITAEPYPDQNMLNQAVSLAANKLLSSQYPNPFKQEMLSEINQLFVNNKFLMLPTILILGKGSVSEDYTLPMDADRFISLGAMTKPTSGSSVYFAKRVLGYKIDQFTELLMHEVIHHVVSFYARVDEVFVESLAQSIMNRTHSRALEFVLTHGIVIRKNFVSGKGLVYEIIKNILERERVKNEDKVRILNNMDLSFIPQNIASGHLSRSYTESLQSQVVRVLGPYGDDIRVPEWASIMIDTQDILLDLAKEVDPKNPWVQKWIKNGFSSCKKKVGFFQTCAVNNLILIQDLFDAERIE